MPFERNIRLVLNIVILGSIIGLVILILLTTEPLLDVPFLFEQIHGDALLIDFTIILFGFVGFLYFFILPGIPVLISGRTVRLEPRIILLVTMYSGVGNYAIGYLSMLFGVPVLGLIAPQLLLVGMVITKYIFDLHIDVKDENRVKFSLKRVDFNSVLIIGLLVVIISLIIRFILFNSNIVEYSDVIDYHQQIESIDSNDFLFNSGFAARAPLYAMYGYLFTFFVPTILASLKIVSFMYSLFLFVPAVSIISSLSKKRDSPFIRIVFPILFIIYPWTMIMASVALQDILLTFYVMSFVALILLQGKLETLAAAIAAGLAFLCRYSAGFLGPLGFVFLLYRDRGKNDRKSIFFLLIWVAIAGSWILRNLLVAGVPFSTTDEGLFSLSYLIPGIGNVLRELGLDRHAMNTITLWIPIVVAVLFSLRNEAGRVKIKSYLSAEYIFIFLVILGQIGTIVLFFSQQYRFLLSVIWFIPVIWVLLMETFEIPHRNFLAAGWILFSIAHALHMTRINWVFYLGREPSSTGPYEVISSIFPTITNSGVFIIGLGLLIGLAYLFRNVSIIQAHRVGYTHEEVSDGLSAS